MPCCFVPGDGNKRDPERESWPCSPFCPFNPFPAHVYCRHPVVWVWELGAAEVEVNQIEFDREKTETHGAESQLAKWSEVYNLRHRIRRHC